MNEPKPKKRRIRKPANKSANSAVKSVADVLKLHCSNREKIKKIGFIVLQSNLFE